MIRIKTIFEFLWKGLIITGLTLVSLMLAGALLTNLGMKFPEVKSDYRYIVLIMLLSGFLISIILGFIAKNLRLTKIRVFMVLFLILILNYITQILEALYFAPGIVTLEVVPAIFGQQSMMALFITGGIAFLYSKSQINSGESIKSRCSFDWLRKILICSGSYVIFYYIFGSINARLFTGEYYLSQMNGLRLPSTEEIIVLETIRAIILVLSIIPLILNLQLTKKKIMITVGIMLFIIGGLIPMLQQFDTLPTVLRVTSTVEMFFQFFLTGVVTAYVFLDEAV
ncbi:hypothetical protein [Desulfosporosinus hippei]|uniref:Uncharacterized protein n=1 Tax=Desulfosporosinus hippei DSM 8344 TaxID=1121419 RepID=A0A1G7UCK5_9FIRM|nr:hypothetical protein [Desulfosporosinus hippei]SDG45335.1 hypothetical protein SAMN05443529_103103 [Desulfosporosinus hippei DSM 8344]